MASWLKKIAWLRPYALLFSIMIGVTIVATTSSLSSEEIRINNWTGTVMVQYDFKSTHVAPYPEWCPDPRFTGGDWYKHNSASIVFQDYTKASFYFLEGSETMQVDSRVPELQLAVPVNHMLSVYLWSSGLVIDELNCGSEGIWISWAKG